MGQNWGVKIENIKSNGKQTIVWEWDWKSSQAYHVMFSMQRCFVFNSCRHVYVSTDLITVESKALEITTFRDKLRENATDIKNGPRERESVSKKGERWASSGLFLLLTSHWPHVDEILSESNRLAVATDGDRPVQVGRRVPVLAVRDPDHRSADLPAQNLSSDFFRFTAENDSRCRIIGQCLSQPAGHECHKSF